MKRKIFIIIAIIVLLTGLGFLLFAPVSNFIGQKKADSVIEEFNDMTDSVVDSVTSEDGTEIRSYAEAVEKGVIDEEGRPLSGGVVHWYVTDDGGSNGEEGYDNHKRVLFKYDLDRLYEDSIEYNRMLLTGQGSADTVRYERAAFDLSDYGIFDDVYCYITIDAIGMNLPVYLGAADSIMSYGAAHLYGTSLPVGDEDMNIAFAGHTDYIGRVFFDDLRELVPGDKVKITTLWDSSYYHVTDYKVVEPDDSSDLVIRNDKQQLTLITCIPDGKGDFNRYLVICERDQSAE